MKTAIRIGILGFVTAVILIFSNIPVSAQEVPTDEQLKQISQNCTSIKTTVSQLHASDALLRVNRGQVYEAVGAKLMNNFNTRLTSNNRDAKGLILVSTSYQAALERFRNDYRDYERQISNALGIDCVSKPLEMHLTIESAREKRATVHNDIVKLNQFIDDYRSAANDFLLNFDRSGTN